MSKHTPGPWHIGSNMILKIINGSYFSIAEVNDWDDETVPNARLIAAAPDLLEALEIIVATEHERHGYNPFWTDQARAAIAKAKGEV